MKIVRRQFDTPVGPMMALATDAALCALEFWKPGRMTRLDARLRRWFTPFEIEDGTNAAIEQTGEWLDGFFNGHPPPDPPLDMRGAPFELRVWAALRLIPPGRTASYGQIARQLGEPGASRAVGMANGANPIAIIVPCHRVIGSNGTLTGYGGGLDRKKWLLDHERGQYTLTDLGASAPLRPLLP
jgi:O-6-methylguanine DNA methyltransferase